MRRDCVQSGFRARSEWNWLPRPLILHSDASQEDVLAWVLHLQINCKYESPVVVTLLGHEDNGNGARWTRRTRSYAARLYNVRLADKGASHDGTRSPLRLPCINAGSGGLRRASDSHGSVGVAQVHRRRVSPATLLTGTSVRWSRSGPGPQTANAERHHHSAFTCGLTWHAGALSPLSHARDRPTSARIEQRRRACRG